MRLAPGTMPGGNGPAPNFARMLRMGLKAFALLFGPTAFGLKAWLRGNWAETVQTSVPLPGTSFLGNCDSEK